MRFTPAAAISLLLVAALSPSVARAAAPPATASGTFEGRTVKLKVAGAYAFWDRSSHERIVNVAVSNYQFVSDAFDAFYDPQPVIENRFVDDETAVIYFQFTPEGKYHGVSYQLASGDGCGFCYDPETKSTVHLAGGRLQGRLAYAGENRTFDVQLDVPLPQEQWGTAIKGDAGEIGKVFHAYNAAMSAADQKAIFDLLDKANQDFWKKQEKDGKLDSYVDYRIEKQHWRMKEAQITGGFQRADQAVLLVKGTSPLIDHLHGQVTLTKENGRWKISEEEYGAGE